MIIPFYEAKRIKDIKVWWKAKTQNWDKSYSPSIYFFDDLVRQISESQISALLTIFYNNQDRHMK